MHTGTTAEVDKPSARNTYLMIDNYFFRFGKKVFRQKIGIPMGVDPAPQIANLYLYYHEVAFMKNSSSKIAAKPRSLTTQVASLMILERWIMMEYSWKKRKRCIQLVLNVENQADNHATFLDIEVDVDGN